MATIEFSCKGDLKKTSKFLKEVRKLGIDATLERYGKLGVEALSAATPKDTGKTAASWTYKIEKTKGTTTLSWHNTNVVKGINVAVILQYGHGTGTGGWVEGIDYINPALRPIFQQIAKDAWEEIIRR